MSEALMQVLLIYFMFLIGVLIFYLWVKKHIHKKAILNTIILLLVLSPFTFYLPIEIKTNLYSHQFLEMDINTGFNLPVIYYKVFKIKNQEAKLFVVEGEDGKHQVGNYYWFKKEGDKWVFTGDWQCIWTNFEGSASEFTLPPYF